MIQLKNISKTYENKGEKIEALKELSLNFKKVLDVL